MSDTNDTNTDLEAKKARLVELQAQHGPNDGAVVELRAEIEAEEKPSRKSSKD